MKKLLIIPFVLISYIVCYAQGVAINQSNIPANASAMLDIESTTKGVLIPRMNTSHRIGIIAPATGLLVYDTDTRSFWFYDIQWKEIAGGGGVSGPASGDLTGSYPSPTVAKIQNLDVVFGVPFDHQVLKWDALANNWKGRNDSLFLPYNVAFGNATKLFGIQNNNTTSGASAICGKSGNAGSGITPSGTMGVWGDNSNGLGVVGTSNTGVGTYGFSFGNHGVYGYSTLQGFAGVKGSHANSGGIGVMGEISNAGKAIYGLSTGTSGKAAMFENTNASSGDTVVVVKNAGFGSAGFFKNTNPTNGSAVIEIGSSGQGDGIYSELTNTGNYPHANFRAYNLSLGGYAFYGQSDLGNACYLYNTGVTNSSYVLDAKTAGLGTVGNFTIANATNNNYVLKGTTNGLGGGLNLSLTNAASTAAGINVSYSGLGSGLVVSSSIGRAASFSVTDAAAYNEALNVSTNADGKNAIFKSNNTSSYQTSVLMEQNGNGKGLEVNLTKASNTFAALTVNTAGNRGVEVVSAGIYGLTSSATGSGSRAISGNTGQSANNAIAIDGSTGANVNNCIAVKGETGVNDAAGIGVKGINYSPATTLGAVTGINHSTGVGVYGEVTATAGYAISGICGQSNLDAHAAKFENTFYNSTLENVSILTNGKGINLYLNNSNASNSQPQFRMINTGSGNFMQFEASPGEIRTTLAKSGNFKTTGTVTVKNDKGIVRSSTTSQLRVEVVQAFWDANGSSETLSPLESRDVSVTFSTAFSSAPAVYIANLLSGANADYMLCSIKNVTTTGCTLHFLNPHSQDINVYDSTWNLVAMGQE